MRINYIVSLTEKCLWIPWVKKKSSSTELCEFSMSALFWLLVPYRRKETMSIKTCFVRLDCWDFNFYCVIGISGIGNKINFCNFSIEFIKAVPQLGSIRSKRALYRLCRLKDVRTIINSFVRFIYRNDRARKRSQRKSQTLRFQFKWQQLLYLYSDSWRILAMLWAYARQRASPMDE